ncbi:hypothetical protein [Mariniblastus fucicola]|uniref:Uncharacterized protein n=1 Tax=Mariniblastus fucicola TaxID=980251 RepID=A0A5B9P4S8_9BACT|nr:hypothetical protein [Mariniblastus fucicola]QEG21607.1 hypothetical protein MFFC18_14650 [Mariniblastus fucicola]
MFKKKMQLRALIAPTLFVTLACAFQPAQAQEKTQFFFAEDVSVGPPRVNHVPRQATPKTKAAAEDFQDRIGGASSVSFENFGVDEDGSKLNAISDFHLEFSGGVTADLTGINGVGVVLDPSKTSWGNFPTHGKKFLSIMSKEEDPNADATAYATIKFSTPQAAFGFCATDIESNRLIIELLHTDGTTEKYTAPVTIPQNSGGCNFIGMINTSRPFAGVRFINAGKGKEGFGFDEMMIAEPKLVEIGAVIMECTGYYERGEYEKCVSHYEKTIESFLRSTKITQENRTRLELAIKETRNTSITAQTRCTILRSAFYAMQYSETCGGIVTTAISEASTFYQSKNYEGCWSSYEKYAYEMLQTSSISVVDRQRLEMALAYEGSWETRCTMMKQTFEYINTEIHNTSLFLQQSQSIALQWSRYFVVSMDVEQGRAIQIESSNDGGLTWTVNEKFTSTDTSHRYIDYSNDYMNSAHRIYRAQYVDSGYIKAQVYN